MNRDKLLQIRAALKSIAPDMRASDALLVGMEPRQTMREFFAREDVKALQEIQKRNHPDSEAHRAATAQIEALAVEIGAAEFFL